MRSHAGPQRLSSVLAELSALRGYARAGGQARLNQAWASVVGEAVARETRVSGVARGVLHVDVGSAPLLAELAGFYRATFVERLAGRFPELNIRDVKFRLDAAANRKTR
jgi:hypothetical protein